MDKMDQIILAVNTSDIKEILDDIKKNNNFLLMENENDYKDLLENSLSKRRGDLEEDPSFKQIIPYLLLRYGDKILYYVRAVGGGEKRLHNKLALGVGGHIQTEDIYDPQETVKVALRREVSEELGLTIEIESLKPLGYIYTEKTDVDKVHLGIVFTASVNLDNIVIQEEELSEASFVKIEELNSMVKGGNYSMENWSSILLDKLEQIFA